MAQAVDALVGREFPPAHLFEKLTDGFGVHGLAIGIRLSFSAERDLD
jgi:hypothetical protein